MNLVCPLGDRRSKCSALTGAFERIPGLTSSRGSRVHEWPEGLLHPQKEIHPAVQGKRMCDLQRRSEISRRLEQAYAWYSFTIGCVQLLYLWCRVYMDTGRSDYGVEHRQALVRNVPH